MLNEGRETPVEQLEEKGRKRNTLKERKKKTKKEILGRGDRLVKELDEWRYH